MPMKWKPPTQQQGAQTSGGGAPASAALPGTTPDPKQQAASGAAGGWSSGGAAPTAGTPTTDLLPTSQGTQTGGMTGAGSTLGTQATAKAGDENLMGEAADPAAAGGLTQGSQYTGLDPLSSGAAKTEEMHSGMLGRLALGQDTGDYFDPYGLGQTAYEEGGVAQKGLGRTAPTIPGTDSVLPWLEDRPGLDRHGTEQEVAPGGEYQTQADQMWSDIMEQMQAASAGREGQFANIMSAAGRRAAELGPTGGGQQAAQLQGGVMAGREIAEIQRQDALREAEVQMTMLQNLLKQAEAAKDRDMEVQLQNMIAQMELEIAAIENPEVGGGGGGGGTTARPGGGYQTQVTGSENVAALNETAAAQGLPLTTGTQVEYQGSVFEIDQNGNWVQLFGAPAGEGPAEQVAREMEAVGGDPLEWIKWRADTYGD